MSGGGRENTTSTWPITVAVVTSVGLDPSDREAAYLTDANLGLYPKAAEVLDSFQMLELLDASGNCLMTKPMRGGAISCSGCRRSEIMRP
jgi:hypothetical protein